MRSISKSAFVAIGVTSLAVAQAPSTGAQNSVASDPGAAPTAGQAAELEYFKAAYGFSDHRAAVAIEREAAAESLLDKVGTLVRSSAWGGAWIDHSAGSTVHVGVTTSGAEKTLAALRLPDYVVVDQVRFSIDELRKQRDEFRAAVVQELVKRAEETSQDSTRDLVAEAISGGWAANVYVDRNMVEIRVPKGSPLSAAAQATKVADGRFEAVRVESVEGDISSRNSSSSTCADQIGDCFPLEAGIQIYGANGGGAYCTTGFTFIRSGTRYSSTASHCAGTPWKHHGHDIGPTAWTLEAHTVDAKMVSITDPNAWKATNLVFRPASSDIRVTSKISNPDNSLQGITVCQVGVGKANQGFNPISCGAVTSIDGQSGSWKNPDWDQMGVATYRDCSGDSGGPVFNNSTGRAYGLVRGKVGSAPFPVCTVGGQGGYESQFTWVSNIESASGYQVLLAQ